MDLGVVPHVHGKCGMKIKSVNARRVNVAPGHGTQLARQFRRGRPLHHQGRFRAPTLNQADQRATRHGRMHQEDLLARLGVVRAPRCFHPLRFPSAKPQPAFGIEVAAVAHAMPDRPARGGRGGRTNDQ